jgi:DNA repair protein RadC
MIRAGELMGITVLDHVIIAENRFHSMKDQKDLQGSV